MQVASFHPRFQASWILEFIPCPALGECVWIASPTRKTQYFGSEKRVANRYLSQYEDHQSHSCNFRVHGKQAFIGHYDTIRSLVPPERLLEYEVRDGWGPLCEFLELECPKEEFPSGNYGDNFKALVRQFDWMRVREATWQNRWMAAVVVVAAAGLRYFST